MEPHAQALPQNRVHNPKKNKHDYPEKLKTGIEITRQVIDPTGFSLLCGDGNGYVNHLRGWPFGDGESTNTMFILNTGNSDFIGGKGCASCNIVASQLLLPAAPAGLTEIVP